MRQYFYDNIVYRRGIFLRMREGEVEGQGYLVGNNGANLHYVKRPATPPSCEVINKELDIFC
jgi:hypothetical protein